MRTIMALSALLPVSRPSRPLIRILVCLLITTAVLPSRGFAEQANSITQFGITWTFDANYPYGQFANGDYWVVGPVSIISIEPNSRNVAGVIKNGSMVNPSPTTSILGYDNTSTRFGYNASYNKAFDVNSSNPLTLAVDSSLISTISVDGINQRPQIKTAAILTVLASVPASGSFRPPYCGITKPIEFNKSELDYTKLAKLTPTIGQPRIGQQVGDAQDDSVERMFERPWIDHTFGWVGDYAHPADNMPHYGREMSAQVGIAALILHLDLPDANKETLMIRFVQLGIDLYGIIKNGGERNYPGDTGIFQGRKWPILFAGIVLNDANMKAIGNKSGDYLYTGGYGPPDNPPPDSIYFGEDDQTFYVSAADVYPAPYTLSAYRRPTTSGTVTCTRGSNTVTGSGTTWKEMLAGFNTYFGALDAEVNDPNGQAYAITSIDSNTTLTLAVPYRGDPNDTNGTVYTGLAYKISDFVYYGHGNIGSYVECEEYLSSDIGLPEWGIKHYIRPLLDGKNWAGAAYRGKDSAGSFVGWILAAHIMNAKTLWNHNALFDYEDRHMQVETRQLYRCWNSWTGSMWDTYRANYGNVWSPPDSNNSAPVLVAISNKAVNENSLLSFTISATDADGNTLTYSATGLPTGATFANQTFTWTPDYNQAGMYQVTFIASDSKAQDSKTITITVNNVNRPPVLATIGNKSINEKSTLSFSISATDADGNMITYSAQNLPSGATFVGQIFSWTPDYNQAGPYQVTFIASDGNAQDSETITITVSIVGSTNRPPVLVTIGNKSINENSTLSFSISATDADGDPITYSAQNLPSGATFVGQTFSWTPDYSRAGPYQVTFIASDGKAQDSKTITITVNNANQAPILSKIGNKSIYTNNLLAFDVNATDPDGDTVTYSATGLPIGATFAGQSFRWTPVPNQASTYHVTFIASDGRLQNSETITIIVYSTDTSAPTVSGLSPAADSIQMPLDRLVILHVADNGDGVDANSVTIKVNDNIVYTGDTADYNSPYGRCHRTGAKADYTFIYQPHTAFDYDQNISVVVNARDLAGNVMSQYSYSFVTETRLFGENKMVNSSSKNLGKGHPAAVRDSAGNIWVAWHAGPVSSSGMERGIYVGKLPAGAANFGTSVREANNPSDRCNAALAIDAYDKLYLAWQDNRRKKWDIYMSTSVDGINWSTETKVTDSDNNAVNPVIAVDHSLPPKAYIAWQDDRAGNQEIYIASSSDGFATETISRITSDSSDHIKPAIAVDPANTVYVVWADSRNGSSDIYGAASNNGPWANVPIVTKSGNQTNPAIATEAAGAILHLLWVDDTAGNKDIYHAASNGLPETSLAGRNIINDNSGADQLTPVIITTGSTGAGLRVFACWQDTRNIGKSGNTNLYSVEVNHGKETNIFVGNNATNSNQSAPVIGVDRYGYPYLVWADDRNQNTDIYYAGSTFVHSNALASQNISFASDAIIGTEPANITGVDDVSVVVPAGAYPCELNITISKVENPPKLPVSLFNFSYGFGPSGVNFSQPVTITIPYSVSASNSPAFAYWYNTLADALSQQGITNVETIAISPTLYAIRFKTTHFTQFIVGGSVSSSIQVAKCTIIAGSEYNSDKISISGKIDATADNFNDAAAIEVTVDSNDMVNPCVLTFPINSKTFKKDKYNYSGTENGVKKSFKYNVKTHSFVSAASNVNLSGLGCPLTFDINVGDYIGTAEVNEMIVNSKSKPIPIILLMGVKYSLRVDKCQVRPGDKESNTDQLAVRGSFTVKDTDVDITNRVNEGLVVTLGTQTFTIPTNKLNTGNGKFTCSNAEVTEGGIAMVSFDFNNCSFMLTIKNTNITASSGTVDFGMAFAGYSQIRQVTLL